MGENENGTKKNHTLKFLKKLYKETEAEDKTGKLVDKQQIKWFGQLMRLNNSRPVKRVWQGKMTGKGHMKRMTGPKKTWENSVADTLKEKNVTGSEINKKM